MSRTDVQEDRVSEQQDTQEPGKLLRVEEVAARLDVPETWLYRAVRMGEFPAVKMGRYVRFRPADVDAWIESGGKSHETFLNPER